MLNGNVSLSSFFDFFLSSFISFFLLFFLLLEKVFKSTHSFMVYETNLFSFFLSFSEYIYTYNFQYLGRLEGKTVLSCTYLFDGFNSQVPFFYGRVTSPSESAGSTFLLTIVQRFCSMLFTGHSPVAGCRTDVFIRRLLTAKLKILFQISSNERLGQSFGLFLPLSLFHPVIPHNDLLSLLCPTIIGHGVLAAFDLYSGCFIGQSLGLVSSNTEE